LLERGLIERATDCGEVKQSGRKWRYRLTDAGDRLAAKSLLKRIPRRGRHRAYKQKETHRD
jgi:hypothetical protein